MKKLLHLFLILLCIQWYVSINVAQAQSITSANRFGSPVNTGYTSVPQAKYYNGKPAYIINENISNNGVPRKIIIFRYDQIHLTWSSKGNGSFEATDFTFDNAGNIYIVGNTTVGFSTLSSTLVGAYMLKLSSTGEYLWGRTLAGVGSVQSICYHDSNNLIILGTVNNKTTMISAGLTQTSNIIPLFTVAEGITETGKIHSDGSNFYFTLSFTSPTLRLKNNTPSFTKRGTKDALMIWFESTFDNNISTEIIYTYHYGENGKSNIINDIAFRTDQFNNVEIIAIGTTTHASNDKDAFIIRQKRTASGSISHQTTMIANSFNNEGISVQFMDSFLYVLINTRGTLTLGDYTVQCRTNYDDLIVTRYQINFVNGLINTGTTSHITRLYGDERTIGYQLVQSNTQEFSVIGFMDGELTAQVNNENSNLLISPPIFYNGFITRISTAPCPSLTIPSAISGPASICQGTSITYSINPVANANSYTWTAPSGWVGTSTDTSITYTPSNTAGNVTVRAHSACGTSSPVRSKVIAIGGTPSIPTSIVGPVSICPNKTQTYTVPEVNGATSYQWTLPSGWSGNSTTNSITITSNANGGNLSVRALNSCGSSNARTLSITTNASSPAKPSEIIGPLEVCTGSTHIYSIPAVVGATSYNWQVASTWVGESDDKTIEITFPENAPVGLSSLSINSVNSCGASAVTQVNVRVINTVPPAPSSITGESSGCPGTNINLYTQPITNVTQYIWTTNAVDFILVGGTGTSTSLTIGQETSDVSVAGLNACGIGASVSKTITVNKPNTPIFNNPPSVLCEAASTNLQVNQVAGAGLYEWTLSSNLSGNQFSNLFQIVNIEPSDDNIAVISVRARGNCGFSNPVILELDINRIPDAPSAIIGSTTPIINTSTPYFVNSVNEVTYNWFASGGNIIGSGNQVNILFTSEGYNFISVSANNVCGNSVSSQLGVTVQGLDNTPPTIQSLNPAHNSIDIGIAPTLSITFNEPIVADPSRLIQLAKLDQNVVVWNYTTSSPEVSISGNTLTITPQNNLEYNTTYYLYVPNNAIKDLTGNYFVGMLSNTIWRFTTTSNTELPLLITSISPENNAETNILDTPITITFNQPVIKHNSGLFTIYDQNNIQLGVNWHFPNFITVLPEGNAIRINYPVGFITYGQTVRYIVSGGIKTNDGTIWTGMDDYYVKFSTITSNYELGESKEISVSPNPFRNLTQLSLPTNWEAITIYDEKGIVIENIQFSGQQTVDLGQTWKEGFYIISILSNDTFQYLKVIKQ